LHWAPRFCVPYSLDPSDELDMLKTEADAIKKNLEEISEVHEAMPNREVVGRWVCEFE
jgi:hypothetical protein